LTPGSAFLTDGVGATCGGAGVVDEELPVVCKADVADVEILAVGGLLYGTDRLGGGSGTLVLVT